MAISFASGEKTNNEIRMTSPVPSESQQDTYGFNHSASEAQTLLFKAQENAISAKEAAMDAINQVYKESEASAESLVKVITGVMQHTAGSSEESTNTGNTIPDMETSQENLEVGIMENNTQSTKPGIIQKILNNGYHPVNRLLGNDTASIHTEKMGIFSHPDTKQNEHFHQLVEDIANESVQSSVGKTFEEANASQIEAQKALEKTEMIKKYAEEAVKQAQEDTILAREEAEIAISAFSLAISKAISAFSLALEIARENADMAISKARQEAMSEAAIEVIQAREEARIAREAADTAMRQAREETRRRKEEVEAANNHAQVAITLAQEKVRTVSAEIEAIQQQSQITTGQAQTEAIKAREEAETAKKMAYYAITKAEEESRKAKEETEANTFKKNEAMTQSQQSVTYTTKGEVTKLKQEIESAIRYPDIQFDKLVQAMKATEDYSNQFDKTDSDYIASILNEMRAPLHSISGFARLMLDDDISDAATKKELLSIIIKQSTNLHRLLDNLSGILQRNVESYII